jgi:diguanylate cyclase (GGDEF)-like protein/PAS domain S-box-containing protein
MVDLVDPAAAALAHSPDILLVIDTQGIMQWASPSLSRLGYDPAPMVGIQVLDYVHPDDLGYALGMLSEAVRRPGEHSPPVFRVVHAEGHWLEVECEVANIIEPDFEGLLLNLRPIAARGLLPGRRRGLEKLLQDIAARCAGAIGADVATVTDWALAQLGEFHGAASVVLAMVEPGRGEVRIDHEWLAPGAVSALAVHPELSVSELLWDYRSPPLDGFAIVSDVDAIRLGESAAYDMLRALGVRACVDVAIVDGSTTIGILSIRFAHPADAIAWDDGNAALVRTAGDLLCLSVARQRAEERLARLAHHDPLTALANRTQLTAALRLALGRRDRQPGTPSLLFCDLDGFKSINDQFGHAAGDRVLVTVARALTSVVRRGDLVARVGGDEFVVLCGEHSGPGDAVEVAERIRSVVEALDASDGVPLPIGVSVGVAAAEADDDEDTLLLRADRAMYARKHGVRSVARAR